MSDTIACPWCAEDIKAEARKCKHCGEFLDAAPVLEDRPPPPPEGGQPVQPIWRFAGILWRCIAHDKAMCTECTKVVTAPTAVGKKGDLYPSADFDPKARAKAAASVPGVRAKFSDVTEDGACPKCGGTQFTAKRSKTGKVIGISTLGVGGLIAPKSQVKCVGCGTMYKRK